MLFRSVLLDEVGKHDGASVIRESLGELLFVLRGVSTWNAAHTTNETHDDGDEERLVWYRTADAEEGELFRCSGIGTAVVVAVELVSLKRVDLASIVSLTVEARYCLTGCERSRDQRNARRSRGYESASSSARE